MRLFDKIGQIGVPGLVPTIRAFCETIESHAQARGLTIDLVFGLDARPPLYEHADYVMFPAFDPDLTTGNENTGFYLTVSRGDRIIHQGSAIIYGLPTPMTLCQVINQGGMYHSNYDKIRLEGEAASLATGIDGMAQFYGNIRTANDMKGAAVSRDFIVSVLPVLARLIGWAKWRCEHHFGFVKPVLVEKGVAQRFLPDKIVSGVVFETSGDIAAGERLMTYTEAASAIDLAVRYVRDPGQSGNMLDVLTADERAARNIV